MTSHKCTPDSNKMNKICTINDKLVIYPLENTIKLFHKTIERVKTNYPPNYKVDTTSNSLWYGNKDFELKQSDIEGLTCASNYNNKFDNLLVLPKSELLKNTDSPVITVKMPFKKCNSFIKKTEFGKKLFPNDVFDSIVKEKVESIREKTPP